MSESEEVVRVDVRQAVERGRPGAMDVEQDLDRVERVEERRGPLQALFEDAVDEPVEGIDPGRNEARAFAPSQRFPEMIAGPLFRKDDPGSRIVLAPGTEAVGQGGDQAGSRRDEDDAHGTRSHRPWSIWARIPATTRPG